jgi:hypothetical protein
MNVYFATSQHVFLEAQPEQTLPPFLLLANLTPSGGGLKFLNVAPSNYLLSLSSIKQVLHAICVNVIR